MIICVVHWQCQVCCHGMPLAVVRCHQACGTWCLLLVFGLVLCITIQAVVAFYRYFNFNKLFESECDKLQLNCSGSHFACRWIILCLSYCFGWSELSSVNPHDSSNIPKLWETSFVQNSTEFHWKCFHVVFFWTFILNHGHKSFALPTSKWYFCVPVGPVGNLGKNSFISWLWVLLVKVLSSLF